jgi:hypothetical protein
MDTAEQHLDVDQILAHAVYNDVMRMLPIHS